MGLGPCRPRVSALPAVAGLYSCFSVQKLLADIWRREMVFKLSIVAGPESQHTVTQFQYREPKHNDGATAPSKDSGGMGDQPPFSMARAQRRCRAESVLAQVSETYSTDMRETLSQYQYSGFTLRLVKGRQNCS